MVLWLSVSGCSWNEGGFLGSLTGGSRIKIPRPKPSRSVKKCDQEVGGREIEGEEKTSAGVGGVKTGQSTLWRKCPC